MNILGQVLSGQSFELILAVATVEGKLRTFVSKLINFNEMSKQVGGVVGKAAQTRAILFDITFLMLCFIVQMYGSDVSVTNLTNTLTKRLKKNFNSTIFNLFMYHKLSVELINLFLFFLQVVLSEQGMHSGGNSFFEQWVRDCMVEKRRPKSPDQMLKHFNTNRVSELLAQFNSGSADFPTRYVLLGIVVLFYLFSSSPSLIFHFLTFHGSQVKWHEVCWSIPLAIKEVLVAWEHEALTANDVKRILDTMKARMCCLPVCATAWLCSYMQVMN